MRRYRPDSVPAVTRLLPASSRFTTVFDILPGYSWWVPVVLNILKQSGTWAGSTRFIPDLHGAATIVTRFISDHQTGMNRHRRPGQWERGLMPHSNRTPSQSVSLFVKGENIFLNIFFNCSLPNISLTFQRRRPLSPFPNRSTIHFLQNNNKKNQNKKLIKKRWK